MLTATSSFTRKHYAFLGKLFLQKHPEQAKEIISQYLPESPPAETDYSKINTFFLRFCALESINPDEYTGRLYKTSKIDVRKKFIAVIIHLYCPQAFIQASDSLTLNRGLVKTLAQVFDQTVANVSINIREVIVWEKQYEDFSRSVHLVIEKLSVE